MAKEPFSIRTEVETAQRFRALSMVLQQDKADLLTDLINKRIETLTEKQREVMYGLLDVWKDN